MLPRAQTPTGMQGRRGQAPIDALGLPFLLSPLMRFGLVVCHQHFLLVPGMPACPCVALLGKEDAKDPHTPCC